MTDQLDNEKLELLHKIYLFKAYGYTVVDKPLSINDSYEEIKYAYELARVRIKNIQEDDIFEQFVDDINNGFGSIYFPILTLYLYTDDPDILKKRIKRLEDHPELLEKIKSGK